MTIDQLYITIVVVGLGNEAQTKQNAQSINVSLTPEENAFINTHLDQLELIK